MSRSRDFGPDLVRAVAAVLVIAVHYFLNTGFYETPMEGGSMLLSAWLRMLCMTCVPLFMALSGWLCLDRRWNRDYLRGVLPVVYTWLLCGALCLGYRALRGDPLVFPEVLLGFLDFTAAPYGWYVEMYLGLYLLMPFLNLAWAGLDRRGRNAFLAVLLVLAVLPSLFNAWSHLLPAFWTGVYPAAYYILGAWLRDRRPRISSWLLLAGWFCGAAAAAVLRWTDADGAVFGWAAYMDWNSPFVALETVCLFLLLVNRDGDRCPVSLRSAVGFFAKLSLPVYLLSYIFDSMFYPLLNGRFPSLRGKLPFFPLIVAAVALGSCLLAWPVDRLVHVLTNKMRGKKNGYQ